MLLATLQLQPESSKYFLPALVWNTSVPPLAGIMPVTLGYAERVESMLLYMHMQIQSYITI